MTKRLQAVETGMKIVKTAKTKQPIKVHQELESLGHMLLQKPLLPEYVEPEYLQIVRSESDLVGQFGQEVNAERHVQV